MQKLILAVLSLVGSQAVAQDAVSRMEVAARAAFLAMPDVRVVDQISGVCGADEAVSMRVAYCTTTNEILLAKDQVLVPEVPYLLGHAFGHAVQVQHGVADVALQTIRARPQDEVVLRGFVDRQVDCIAGFLFAKAGFAPASLATWMSADPFDDIHWGRNPLKVGPVMPVPLLDRDIWFRRGQSGDLAACAVGEFGADLLIEAYQG
ncbi:MAG: hypothetical protein ACJAXK_001540 [Yoonia sp.]|jgi:hypothetical protein